MSESDLKKVNEQAAGFVVQMLITVGQGLRNQILAIKKTLHTQ